MFEFVMSSLNLSVYMTKCGYIIPRKPIKFLYNFIIFHSHMKLSRIVKMMVWFRLLDSYSTYFKC